MIHDKALMLAEALESGRYKQGKTYLRVSDAFCCLGVACDLFDPTAWELVEFSATVFRYLGKEASVLPYEVQQYFGFSSDIGTIPSAIPSDKYFTLAGMNDNGKSFTEIAAFIRENWENL